MRNFLLISLFFSFHGHSQNVSYNPYGNASIFENFNKEDSIDGIFPKAEFLLVMADTIPISTMEESHLWRYLRVVNYYYDSLNVLWRVYYKNGQDGSYYLYFDESNLVKARFISPSSAVFVFYYNQQHNKLSISEIENAIENDGLHKKFYEVLKLAHEFMKNGKSLKGHRSA